MVNKERGFTFVELLIVLGISFTIILIGSSIQVSLLNHYRSEQFLMLFQNDVLYMQQKTIISRENIYMNINPNQHTYEIKQGIEGKTLVQREIPKEWTVRIHTLSMPISFTFEGVIKHPGMFSIHTGDKDYYIYFPFGIGRSYFIEK